MMWAPRLELLRLLDDGEIIVAVEQWQTDRATCVACMRDAPNTFDGRSPPAMFRSAAPALFLWLLFAQWCLEEWGAVPSGA